MDFDMNIVPIWDARMCRFRNIATEALELGLARGFLPFTSPPAYVERAPQAKADYTSTDWYHLFTRLENDLGDFNSDLSKDGKLFRKRFRLPFSQFYDIYATVQERVVWIADRIKTNCSFMLKNDGFIPSAG
jgi:hypothetical protein